MTYKITASKLNHKVEQEATSKQLMQRWLRAFRLNGWKVQSVLEITEGGAR